MRSFKTKYLAAIVRGGTVKKTSRPLTSGEIDGDVLNYVKSLRATGTPISVPIVLAAAEGIVRAMNQTCLAEPGMVKDPDLPVCQVCHVCVKTKHANTSNLYSHLKKHHPIQYQAVRPKRNDKGKGKALSSTTRECTIEESFNPLTTDDAVWHRLTLAACYRLAQSVLKIDFVLAKKAG